MPPADMTTQRAYTLRLRPVDAKDDRWREQLWQTHKTVNRGARVFGDFLLTLRGGLSHELAATEDGAQRRQRGKGPEQGNADVETRRKYQRRLLALSWLSVESEEGAPSEYKLGDQESPVGALRDILSKRGLSGAEIEYWVADCQPTLEATIRDDACWVNRAEAFEHYEEAVGGCTEEEVWDFLAFFLGTPSRYTAPLAPLPGSTKHSEGEDEEDPRQVSQDPGKTRARDPDQGPKDLVQKAGQWLSARFGTGKGADFTRIADAYRRIAEWATHTDPSSLSSGAKALLALAAHLGVSVRKGDGLTAVLSLISGPGHKSKTRNRLRNINAQHRPVNTEDMASLAQDAAADSGDCRAKVDRKGGRSYADRILRAVEQATGMSYLQSGGPARHYEMAVMLDHAARRVSAAHTWIKRAEEQRLKFERDRTKMSEVPEDARRWLDEYCERRAQESGSLERYVIRRRAVQGWREVVAKWASLSRQNQEGTDSQEQRVEAARQVKGELEDKFGDIALFEDLAEEAALCVWQRDGQPVADILLHYVGAANAEANMTRRKVPAYRHPHELLHPVFCEFGDSRWQISFDVHKSRRTTARQAKSESQARSSHGLELRLWDGSGMCQTRLLWHCKRLVQDLALSQGAAEAAGPEVSRADRLGRAAAGASSGPVSLQSIFDQKHWNGRLQAPREQLEDLHTYVEKHGWDEKARRRLRSLRWFLTFSPRLTPCGPLFELAEHQQLKVSAKSGRLQLMREATQVRIGHVPGLRVLSVDLGHRYAAACAVWETVKADQVNADCRKAKKEPPGEEDLFLHLRIPRAAKSGKHRTVIYRRIGANKLADGSLHPCPWARLDRQFLIKLQGEDEPARWPCPDEIEYVDQLFEDLKYIPWWRSKPTGEIDRPRRLRVDELMSEAVSACRRGLSWHGRVAVLAHCLIATHKSLSGGRTEELTEKTRREELTSALMSWYQLACGGGSWAPDETARKLWEQLRNALPADMKLPDLSQEYNSDDEENRQARKRRQDQLRASLAGAAAALAGDFNLRSRFHKLWSQHWSENDKAWRARLRQLRRWILPRPSHLLDFPRETQLDKRSLTREQRNELLKRVRNVGGLSLTRLATIRSLYQVQKAYAMRPHPEDPRRNVPQKGDTSLDRFGQRTLDTLEHMRENRVKQLASRIVEAALGIGLEQPDLKRKRGGRAPSRPRCRRFAPCHAVVIENLEHYRPDQVRTRRENRQLMTWSAGKVRKYLEEGCFLAGLRLCEVYAGYTSRQDSRTGAPGIRCSDVPPEWIVSKSGPPWVRTRVESAVKGAGKSDATPADQYLADLYSYLANLPEEKRLAAVRIPDRRGDIFVSADPAAGRGIQADLNAAANIGLKALLDPDWEGAWWYVPCDPSTYRPKPSEWLDSKAIDTETPLRQAAPRRLEVEPASKRGRSGRTGRGKTPKSDTVNLWRDVSCAPVRRDHGPWCEYGAYWGDVEQRVVRLLRERAGLGDP